MVDTGTPVRLDNSAVEYCEYIRGSSPSKNWRLDAAGLLPELLQVRELLWSNNATRAGCQERALGALTTYSCGPPSHLVWHRHPSLQLRHLGARALSSPPSDDAPEHLCHRVPPLRRHDDEVRSLRRTPAPTSYKAGTCSHFVKHRHPPLRRAPAPLTSCRGGTMTRCLHSVEPRHSERALLPLTLQIRRQRSEEHTSELQSRLHLVCRLLLEKKKESLARF